MTKEELIKIIEDNIKPCNSTYKKSREDTAKRIFEALLAADIKPPERTYLERVRCSSGLSYVMKRTDRSFEKSS